MQIIKRNLIKSRISNLILLVGMLCILSACGGNKMFEAYNTIEANSWEENAIQTLAIEITDQSKPLDLYFTIKNGLDYPYHNLYVKYRLVQNNEEKVTLITEGLEEFILFDPKTGAPYGSGSSGWFDQEFMLKNNFQFDESGKYEIQFQQYMRKGSLNEVAAVGFAFDSPNPE